MSRKQATKANLNPESDEQTGEMSVENKQVASLVSKQLASRIEIKCIFAGNCR